MTTIRSAPTPISLSQRGLQSQRRSITAVAAVLFHGFHRRRLAAMCLAAAEGRISAQFGLYAFGGSPAAPFCWVATRQDAGNCGRVRTGATAKVFRETAHFFVYGSGHAFKTKIWCCPQLMRDGRPSTFPDRHQRLRSTPHRWIWMPPLVFGTSEISGGEVKFSSDQLTTIVFRLCVP